MAMVRRTLESVKKEMVELIIREIIILDLSSAAFVIDTVWRIRDDEICLLALHQ